MLWQFNGENREGEKMGQIMMSSSPKECGEYGDVCKIEEAYGIDIAVGDYDE